MSRTGRRYSRIWQGFAIIIALSAKPILAAHATVPAVKATKAKHSLLVDIEKAGDHFVVAGERGHILISSDAGASWQQSDVPVSQMLNSVSFVDANYGWAAGYDGHILNTTDGGKAWEIQRNGLNVQAEVNAKSLQFYRQEVADLKKRMESTKISASEILNLKDALDEAQWQLDSAKEKIESPVVTSPLLDIWFSDRNNGWAVGAFGTLLRTTDGGINWLDISGRIDNEMGYHLNAVTGLADGSIVVAGESGFITFTQDDGKTWKVADLGYEGTIFALKVNPLGTEIVATGLRGKTFIAKGDWMDWSDITPDVGFSLAGVEYIDDGKFLLVGAGGTLALTKDGGVTYSYKTLVSRASISTAAYQGNNQFILVGQGGIRLTSLTADTVK